MEPEVRNKLDLAIEIRDVYAREILDFAGNPAIEVEVKKSRQKNSRCTSKKKLNCLTVRSHRK